jgi:adhesin HecA-like repeat protein
MRRLVYTVLLGIFAASVSFSQAGPLRTGFAVVTPITGGRLAFSVTETFTERFEGNLLQSSVQPSPLVTATSIVVTSDPASAANTGIAILNPFDVAASVTLTLLNQQGVIIGAKTVTLGARQQTSRFLTQLFPDVPELTESFTGQLFINSNVPIAVLALAFSGPFFTALPSTQLSGNNTAVGGSSDLGGIISPFGGIAGALFLPQVASGGGWVSTITIANTSILPQSVRVDFFDSTGGLPGLPVSTTIPNTVVQPGGVVSFSTGTVH